jgi:uncharacterized membrane protein YhaH (DUF805 family)
MTGFGTAIRVCTLKYIKFSGRACRSEFWWFSLVAAVVSAGVTLARWYVTPLGPAWSVLVIVLVAIVIPWLAVGSRRLQDTGLPGCLVLVPLLMPALSMLSFYAMWFVAGDAAPRESNDFQAVASSVLVVIALLLNWLIYPVWAIFVYLLSRPSQREINRYGPPP